ncbi:MAG TPA: Gfo/Idh/MocA family oxidoreductase [Opitutaceae bacterium]|nr:Gfo/Idh/MocA family oxidoreductase [Opitutaceae bacterium]
MTAQTQQAIGFGIVGSGMISGFHAQAIQRTPGARLVGFAARSPEKAAALAAKHDAPFSTVSVAELVNHPDVQVVCICTPSGVHYESTIAAIDAGRHVVVEKPVEVTTELVDRIIEAAEKKGVLLASIFQGRFGAGASTVKAALDAGRLGRMVIASVSVKWHRSDAYYNGWKGVLALDGGGAVMNQAIHGVDLLQWFVGMPVEVVAFKANRVHTRIESEDTACALLRFADGAMGTVEATTAAWPGWSRRIELCGERGSIALEDDRITRWDFRDARPEDEAIRKGSADALGSGAADPGAISLEGHLRQFANVVAALRTGEPLAIDGREGRKAVSFVEAIYTSATTGKPVAPR